VPSSVETVKKGNLKNMTSEITFLLVSIKLACLFAAVIEECITDYNSTKNSLSPFNKRLRRNVFCEVIRIYILNSIDNISALFQNKKR
jgi:hypothetical protein